MQPTDVGIRLRPGFWRTRCGATIELRRWNGKHWIGKMNRSQHWHDRWERDGGYAGLSDTLVDLRADDHERPVEELGRLYRLHQALFGRTPRSDWIPVDDALRAEIEERLATAGYATLDDWGAVENLEERIDGTDRIDPVVLEALRNAS